MMRIFTRRKIARSTIELDIFDTDFADNDTQVILPKVRFFPQEN